MLPVWELQISLFAGDDVTSGLVVVWELYFRGLGAVVAPDPTLLASCTNARRDSFVRERAERRGTKTEKGFKRWEIVMGKRSRWVFPHGSSRYSCCGRRGLSRGVVRLFVAALVVEIRPLVLPKWLSIHVRPEKVLIYTVYMQNFAVHHSVPHTL